MKIDSKQLDSFLEVMLRCADKKGFQVKDVLENIPESLDEDRDALELRIERELDGDNRLFKNFETDRYFLKKHFFNGKTFLVTPDEIEIDNGILMPGHRFCIFCEEEIFPSEISLNTPGGTEVKTREFTHNVTELVPYHILMGSEQIFDYFIAENPANLDLLDQEKPADKVTLNVFDMSDFYAANQFSTGDALIVRVCDWENGVFNFDYLSGSERRDKQVTSWIEEFSGAVEKVIDTFENYLEIPDQLRWAYFFGGSEMLSAESASLDEFYNRTDRIAINFEEANHTVLSRKIAPDSTEPELPENVGISKGRTGSLQAMLEDIGCTLKPAEIEAWMRMQCFNRNYDFEAFFRRCFGSEQLNFADDAQEAVFMNYIEERWEFLTANYNREQDVPKAGIRARILELTEERSDWLEELRSLDIDLSLLPQEKMDKLAETAIYLSEMLELLNSDEHSLQLDDADKLEAAIDDVADLQLQNIEYINKFINK
ncbi:hypothetical protein P0136_06435 [Lentisphaerota bacterium ZTH]|nr:hypothetical protein JYG24_02455 [Lentisphaerota bacterium]WET07627.1 hypothetical protein P0136_06435 [Lentisphaerota bacterium ZTH]